MRRWLAILGMLGAVVGCSREPSITSHSSGPSEVSIGVSRVRSVRSGSARSAAREGMDRARLFGTVFPLDSVAVDPRHEGLKYGSLISSPRNVPLPGLGSSHNFWVGL